MECTDTKIHVFPEFMHEKQFPLDSVQRSKILLHLQIAHLVVSSKSLNH